MKSITHVVMNPLGVHARPAAMIAQRCVNQKSVVTITCNGKSASGSNVLQILGLHAKKGDILEIRVEGVDEEQTLAVIEELLEQEKLRHKQAVKPALVTLEDSRVRQSSGAQVNVGISGDGNNAAKGLLVATDCVWTNASGRSVFVGGGNVPGSAGHVILSNCVYKTEGTTQNGYSFVLGQTSGTTGRLDIVRGTVDSDTAGGFNTSKVSVGAAAGAIGILALHGRNLTSFPSFSFTEGSDSTIELVDGTYFKDSALTIGSERKNGFSRFHVRGGSFSIGTTPFAAILAPLRRFRQATRNNIPAKSRFSAQFRGRSLFRKKNSE